RYGKLQFADVRNVVSRRRYSRSGKNHESSDRRPDSSDDSGRIGSNENHLPVPSDHFLFLSDPNPAPRSGAGDSAAGPDEASNLLARPLRKLAIRNRQHGP